MMLSFLISIGFNLSYCVYWLLGWLGVQVSNKPLDFALDSYGKVASMVYIILSGAVHLVLLGYFCYLKTVHHFSKQETLMNILRNHKRLLMGWEALSLLLALSIVISIVKDDISDQVDYIMVHSMLLCILSYVRLYKAIKLFGVFDESVAPLAFYFFFLGAAIVFVLIIDFHVESKKKGLVKDDICSNLAIILQLLYLQLVFNREMVSMQVILKITIYSGMIRGLMLLASDELKQLRHSLEFAYSIAFDCILVFVVMKDAIVLVSFIKAKLNAIREKRMLQRRYRLVRAFINNQLRLSMEDSSSANLGHKEQCAICLGGIEEGRVVFNCNHEFHADCATEWLRSKPVCPLCQVRVISE